MSWQDILKIEVNEDELRRLVSPEVFDRLTQEEPAQTPTRTKQTSDDLYDRMVAPTPQKKRGVYERMVERTPKRGEEPAQEEPPKKTGVSRLQELREATGKRIKDRQEPPKKEKEVPKGLRTGDEESLEEQKAREAEEKVRETEERMARRKEMVAKPFKAGAKWYKGQQEKAAERRGKFKEGAKSAWQRQLELRDKRKFSRDWDRAHMEEQLREDRKAGEAERIAEEKQRQQEEKEAYDEQTRLIEETQDEDWAQAIAEQDAQDELDDTFGPVEAREARTPSKRQLRREEKGREKEGKKLRRNIIATQRERFKIPQSYTDSQAEKVIAGLKAKGKKQYDYGTRREPITEEEQRQIDDEKAQDWTTDEAGELRRLQRKYPGREGSLSAMRSLDRKATERKERLAEQTQIARTTPHRERGQISSTPSEKGFEAHRNLKQRQKTPKGPTGPPLSTTQTGGEQGKEAQRQQKELNEKTEETTQALQDATTKLGEINEQ